MPQIKRSWEFTSKYVQSNFPAGQGVPQKTLRDDESGLTITCVPFREIFEPCIVYDNTCQITITSDQEFPATLLKKLNSLSPDFIKFHFEEKNNRQISRIFFMDGDGNLGLGIVFNIIQQYLILIQKFTGEKQIKMQQGFDKLRKFALLPNQAHYLPVHSNQFFSGHVIDQIRLNQTISDEEMANSAFGQASNTARNN
ncbi:MAG: hypothetical protein V4501_10910 [Pseudomonadota bacterium]